MPSPAEETDVACTGDGSGLVGQALVPALVIAWFDRAPDRVGEAFLVPEDGVAVLGRSTDPPPEGRVRCRCVRQRPGRTTAVDPDLASPRISRVQLELERSGAGLEVRCAGRAPLSRNGLELDRCTVEPGDVLTVGDLVLVCVRRPLRLPPLRDFASGDVPRWGRADRFGLVGESPSIWALRDRLAFVGARSVHVLVQGDSGAGKELCARAIHGLSARAKRPLIARSAATFPEGLIEAELFGNRKGYPNPGTPDRPGLIGAADGSTLFLDEIGELREDMQARLLRVLDRGGEYHRLGESRARTADVRLVAATNRDDGALKHDLLARLELRVVAPGLNERREDIGLLISHLMRGIASDDPALGERFLVDGRPSVQAELVRRLVQHPYTHHVRQLKTLLWRALGSSRGRRIELTDDVEPLLVAPEPAARRRSPGQLTELDVRAALQRQDWVQEKAWRDLGLNSRHQLARLMRKMQIEPPSTD